MAIKAVNNLAGPNRIIPTLLVFGVYPRLIKINPLSLSITKRIEAICVVIKEVYCLYIERQVKDILTIYNGLNTKITLDLPLQLNIYIQRKKEGQKGPYKLIVINKETYIINMPQRPTKFQSTVIKPYLTKQPN